MVVTWKIQLKIILEQQQQDIVTWKIQFKIILEQLQ